MNDLTSLRLTSKLVEQSVLVDAATLRARKPENTEAAAASWLDGDSGVFKSPFVAAEDAVEDHYGEATELPTALPADLDEGDSPFQPSEPELATPVVEDNAPETEEATQADEASYDTASQDAVE